MATSAPFEAQYGCRGVQKHEMLTTWTNNMDGDAPPSEGHRDEQRCSQW